MYIPILCLKVNVYLRMKSKEENDVLTFFKKIDPVPTILIYVKVLPTGIK